MSILDGKRLDPDVFKLDAARMRQGWYSDFYFINAQRILTALSKEGYRFEGSCPEFDGKGIAVNDILTGDLEVEMQYFTKREPFAVVAGVDHAIAMFRECTGYHDDSENFVNTFDQMEIDAVQDGGRLAPWDTVLRIRGRYRDFAMLETPTLGAIARRTRIATNVYMTLKAARNKPVFFFPARHGIHEAQAGDGHAYGIAVERFNREENQTIQPLISTFAQGDWWGEQAAGTISHSFILCFLGDIVEAMMAFARLSPVDIRRIALVDTKNDSVGDSLGVAEAMFHKYRHYKEAGNQEEAQKYVLFGVRADTAEQLRDVSVEPLGDPAQDCGVNPRLIFKLRVAMDNYPDRMDLPDEWREEALKYFRNIKIVASGGFTPEKIQDFERRNVPVDIYGIGSSLVHGEPTDFTADVVRVKIDGQWHDMAKVGRRPRDNPDLERVT